MESNENNPIVEDARRIVESFKGKTYDYAQQVLRYANTLISDAAIIQDLPPSQSESAS